MKVSVDLTDFTDGKRIMAHLNDCLITIDRGRLVEDGTHEELINWGGRYAALQAGIQEVG